MGTYINTKDILGEQTTLDGLVEGNLSEFVDADVTTLEENAFRHDLRIEHITLPNLTQIGNQSFAGSRNLKTLRIGLEKDSVCKLKSSSGVSLTGHCVFFVPPNLVSNYKAASNWSSVASRIYGDGDANALIWDESEIADSDSTLFERINNGTAADYYKFGQYKSIDLGSFGTLRMQIIGKNVDELSDGTGNAQLTWFSMDSSSSMYRRMNPALSGSAPSYTEGTGSIGGWDKSEMKAYLYSDIWSAIPSEWKSVIKEVKKYSKGYDSSGQVQNNVLTNEKIWLLSRKETNGYEETMGPTYSVAFTSDSYTIGKSGYSYYWTRTAVNMASFVSIANAGGGNTNNATASNYIFFGFCT